MSKGTKTRYALLGILTLGPSSGYDIKKAMERSTDHFWREGDGSIYPILKQLLEEGLVTCELANVESDKPKKIYTITNDGQRELEDWLSQDPVLLPQRNELLLKVFFGWNVDNQVTVRHITKFQQFCKSILENFADIEKLHFPKPLSGGKMFRYLTLRAGITYTEASLAWCDDALRMLKNA